MYAEWVRISSDPDARMHQPWRESPGRFIREVLAELGKPPWVSIEDWHQRWEPPAA